MIKYDKLWQLMEEKNITIYRLREECSIGTQTIKRLKENDNPETKTLNKICCFLKCKLEDIAEYVE